MPIDPRNPFDKAAIDHTSIKVKSFPRPIGKVVYSKTEKGLQINIVNSPIGYPAEKRQAFGEMIQVLQEEGKIGPAGSIPINSLELM